MSPIDDSPRAVVRRVLLDKGLAEPEAAALTESICAEFAGGLVYFATSEWVDRDGRDDLIRAARRAGRSWNWIAKNFLVSRTHARRICQEGRAA